MNIKLPNGMVVNQIEFIDNAKNETFVKVDADGNSYAMLWEKLRNLYATPDHIVKSSLSREFLRESISRTDKIVMLAVGEAIGSIQDNLPKGVSEAEKKKNLDNAARKAGFNEVETETLISLWAALSLTTLFGGEKKG
jgi:alkaline phosphatase